MIYLTKYILKRCYGGKKVCLKTYSSIWLLCGITVGSILGLVFGKDVAIIKPLGDFLNLLLQSSR
jgi:Na+/H+-dicarboxylate symporter